MRFLIVVPTVRRSLPGFDEAQARLRASFTHPTELHVLDGAAGKAQTLNAAYDALLKPSDAEIYVTLDDDLVPSPGWQDELVRAFDADPRWGALGLWLGEPHRAYMGLALEVSPVEVAGVSFFPADSHVVGCLVAFRREVALQVGKIPGSPEKYQFWEDGWRGGRVRACGHKLAYVHAPDCVPELVAYDDAPAYLASKAADIASAKNRGFWSRAWRRLRRRAS